MRQQPLAIFHPARQGLLAQKRVHDALAAKNGELRLGDILQLGGIILAGLSAERTPVPSEPVAHPHGCRRGLDVTRWTDAVEHDPIEPALGKIARDSHAEYGRRAVNIRRGTARSRLRVVEIVNARTKRERDSIIEERQVPPCFPCGAVAMMAGHMTLVDVGDRGGEIPEKILPIIDLPGVARMLEHHLGRCAAQDGELLGMEVQPSTDQEDGSQFPRVVRVTHDPGE